MTALAPWLARLDEETRRADAAEAAIRAEFAHRIALAADERAIAYRRLNFVRGLADTVAPAADAGEAVARGVASLQARFGWDADPETPHGQIATMVAPVCRAVWAALPGPRHAEESPEGASRSTQDESGGTRTEDVASPATALAAFERAYAERTGSSFWVLFDNPMPETPRVDY